MFGMGHWEILIIFLVILLIFGAKRIPEMAQGLGKGIKEFRKAMRDVQDEIDINNTGSDSTRSNLETGTPPQSVAQNSQSSAPPVETPAQEKTGASPNQSAS